MKGKILVIFTLLLAGCIRANSLPDFEKKILKFNNLKPGKGQG